MTINSSYKDIIFNQTSAFKRPMLNPYTGFVELKIKSKKNISIPKQKSYTLPIRLKDEIMKENFSLEGLKSLKDSDYE